MREILVEESTTVFKQIKNQTKQQISGKLSSIINSHRTIPVSFELCPNRTIDNNLLELLKPCFLSITWLLVDDVNLDINEIPALLLAEYLQNQGYDVLLHLTGRNFDKHNALSILEKIRNIGIRNLLILQGDPSFTINRENEDFPYASSFIRFIREHFQDYFYIAVAGYPEKHPESLDYHQDLLYLKRKVSSGADLMITQASFQYESILKFSNNCRNYSINIPIIIGIFIINSYQSLMKMVEFCNLHIPIEILKIMNDNRYNEEAIREYGIDLTVNLIKQILNNNDTLICGVHIFTLNHLNLIKCVLKRLGMIEWWIERPLITDLSYK